MPTLAIVSFVAAACVCCALCGYGIATAVRRHRERRDRLMHVVSFHKGASQRGRRVGERARRHAGRRYDGVASGHETR